MKNRVKQKNKDDKVLVMGKTLPAVRDAINELAEAEDRSFSNMVARLLEESPRVQEKLREVQAA